MGVHDKGVEDLDAVVDVHVDDAMGRVVPGARMVEKHEPVFGEAGVDEVPVAHDRSRVAGGIADAVDVGVPDAGLDAVEHGEHTVVVEQPVVRYPPVSLVRSGLLVGAHVRLAALVLGEHPPGTGFVAARPRDEAIEVPVPGAVAVLVAVGFVVGQRDEVVPGGGIVGGDVGGLVASVAVAGVGMELALVPVGAPGLVRCLDVEGFAHRADLEAGVDGAVVRREVLVFFIAIVLVFGRGREDRGEQQQEQSAGSGRMNGGFDEACPCLSPLLSLWFGTRRVGPEAAGPDARDPRYSCAPVRGPTACPGSPLRLVRLKVALDAIVTVEEARVLAGHVGPTPQAP